MKILITGARGFIGKNLTHSLRELGYTDLYLYDLDTPEDLLTKYAKDCDFVFHLAGVNRPENSEDFMTGNFGFTTKLLASLAESGNKAPVVITSSIQADQDNPYGKSKKAGEDYLISYSKEQDVSVCVYRLANVFGKWTKPNYNSAVATFCYNVSRDITITVNDRNAVVNLVYIDDVVTAFIALLDKKLDPNKFFYETKPIYSKQLGEIVDLIYSFKKISSSITLPFVGDEFIKKLYSTYLSYLPKEDFSYRLTQHKDDRGSFAELFRTEGSGQISVNISKPGVAKGNHWHHSKIEKFVVIKGTASINLRHIETGETVEYIASEKDLKVVDIPPGYTHNIINTGKDDLIAVIWANESFDKDNPDTYFLEV